MCVCLVEQERKIIKLFRGNCQILQITLEFEYACISDDHSIYDISMKVFYIIGREV